MFQLPKLNILCCTETLGLSWGIIIVLKFHAPSHDLFLQSFPKFMKVLKIGIFGILAEWKMHYLANSTVTGMPYLPAKVELVSLNRFSSQGLWKWYNSRVFDQRLYAWRQHLMFCRFSRKRKFFGNWLWFSKMSHQRAFFTEYEEFRNFSFDSKFSIFTDSHS